jgi:hypothetical protein
MNFYTYTYFDPERQVPIYVGKGKGQRAYDHLGRTKNRRFYNRLRLLGKKGLQPTITVSPSESENAAFDEEKRLIALYGRKDLGLGPLYNMTDGGEGASGAVPSAETRTKLSEAVKASYTPELRAMRSSQFKNKKASREARAKMSAAKLGTNRSEASRLKQGASISGENNHAALEWTLLSPDNNVIVTKSLRQFCDDRGLAYIAFKNRRASGGSTPISKGPSKGWSLLSCQ